MKFVMKCVVECTMKVPLKCKVIFIRESCFFNMYDKKYDDHEIRHELYNEMYGGMYNESTVKCKVTFLR